MKLLYILLQPFLYILLLLNFTLCLVPVSVLALPFKQSTRLKMTAPFWTAFFYSSIYYIICAQVTKIDLRDEKDSKAILPQGLYIANHQSFADIPLIFSTFIIPPIMKKSLLYIPIFGLCAYSSGAILVDRKNMKSRKKVYKLATDRLVSSFKQLQYYPEGTRSKDGRPKDYAQIKTALIRFAYSKGINVFPVSIYGTSSIFDKKIVVPRRKLGIKFHEPLNPNNFENKDEFCEVCWKQVQTGYAELETQLS